MSTARLRTGIFALTQKLISRCVSATLGPLANVTNLTIDRDLLSVQATHSLLRAARPLPAINDIAGYPRYPRTGYTVRPEPIFDR